MIMLPEDLLHAVQDEYHSSPQALALACAVSPAARVEPELIRFARLRILPHLSAGVEAELWHSAVMSGRGYLAVVMDPVPQERFRDFLSQASNHEVLDRIRNQVIEPVHKFAPEALRVEEKVTYLAMRYGDAGMDQIQKELGRSVRALYQNSMNQGLAWWAHRLLKRAPQAVTHSKVAAMLDFGAAVSLRLPCQLPHESRDKDLSWMPHLVPPDFPSTPVGIRLLAGALEFTHPPGSGSHPIEVPETDPLMLDVRTESGETRTAVEIPLRGVQGHSSMPANPGIVQVTWDQANAVIRTVTGSQFRLEAKLDVSQSEKRVPVSKRATKRSRPTGIADLKGNVDFAIFTVREDEFRAVLDRFPECEDVLGKKLIYKYASFENRHANRPLTAVIVRLLEQGHTAAQATATHVINEIDPGWLILTGIAGSVPISDQTLGDVALASRFSDFSISAVLQDKPPEWQQRGGPTHWMVSRLLAWLPGADLGDWNTAEALLAEKPGLETPFWKGKLYGTDEIQHTLRNMLERQFPGGKPARQPKFHIGVNATASILVKDTELLAQWKKSARHLTHVEMEAGGVYEAARAMGDKEYPLLCVRGISDIIGYKRSDKWTEFACHSAASLLRAVLANAPFDFSDSFEVSDSVSLHVPGTEASKASPVSYSQVLKPNYPPMTSGPVPLNSPYYIERSADKMVKYAITDPGIKKVTGPWQSGKTSLLYRVCDEAQSIGAHACMINLTGFGVSELESLETLCLVLAREIHDQFEFSMDPTDNWDGRRGPKINLRDYLSRGVLDLSESRIHLILDEVDVVFASPQYRDEFLTMLRSWHERSAAGQGNWQRLSIWVSYSTDPTKWMGTLENSPFNVGMTIELTDFTPEEVGRLNNAYGSPLDRKSITSLVEWVGGCPFLVHTALNALARSPMSLEELRTAYRTSGEPFTSHLDSKRRFLHAQDLERSLREVWRIGRVSDAEFWPLKAAGLVSGTAKNATLRCQLYADLIQDPQ